MQVDSIYENLESKIKQGALWEDCLVEKSLHLSLKRNNNMIARCKHDSERKRRTEALLLTVPVLETLKVVDISVRKGRASAFAILKWLHMPIRHK